MYMYKTTVNKTNNLVFSNYKNFTTLKVEVDLPLIFWS